MLEELSCGNSLPHFRGEFVKIDAFPPGKLFVRFSDRRDCFDVEINSSSAIMRPLASSTNSSAVRNQPAEICSAMNFCVSGLRFDCMALFLLF